MVQLGAYIYGIVLCDNVMTLGEIGLNGEEVVTIPESDLSAVVHWCDPEGYKSEDPEIIKRWVLAHQQVVDRIWKEFGDILPMHFGMVVIGESQKDVIGKVISWIDQMRDPFLKVFSKIKDRAEYGVQVFRDGNNLKENVIKGDSELLKRRDELVSMSKGMAYLKKQGFESLLKKTLAEKIDSEQTSLVEMISPVMEHVSVEKCKESRDDKVMILNLSCLANGEEINKLGGLLEEFEKRPGLSVRFTGPWPPYSFVEV